MFWFVAGGHAFELIIVLTIATISMLSGVEVFQQLVLQISRTALILTTIYLLTELYAFIKSRELTGGDFTGQWEISPSKTIIFYLFYFTGLIGVWYLLK